MPTIECKECHKIINIEDKQFVIENKCYYHKKCYLSHVKRENKKIYLPKLKKFSIYFSISLLIFIILSLFQDIANPFSVFFIYILMVLTISFGIMMVAFLIQFIRFK